MLAFYLQSMSTKTDKIKSFVVFVIFSMFFQHFFKQILSISFLLSIICYQKKFDLFADSINLLFAFILKLQQECFHNAKQSSQDWQCFFQFITFAFMLILFEHLFTPSQSGQLTQICFTRIQVPCQECKYFDYCSQVLYPSQTAIACEVSYVEMQRQILCCGVFYFQQALIWFVRIAAIFLDCLWIYYVLQQERWRMRHYAILYYSFQIIISNLNKYYPQTYTNTQLMLIYCYQPTIYIIKLAPMDQIDDLENVRRNLDPEDDLELMADHDEEHQEMQLKNKIIFNMQGLGSIKHIKRNDKILEAYIKGPHCEESVKDLVKFIRMDSPVNPKARFILSEFNVIETDLLELLVLQVQDKKLSFWIIALMALLTAKPNDQLSANEKQKLNDSLRQYKNSFVKHQCFQILMVHIADFYKTSETQKLRAHYQMIQFIILLIRNLAQISNSQKYPHLHNHFLAAFIKEDMFNPLLYMIQTDRSQLMSKIDIPLLEICYHTFTCFQPQSLYNSQQNTILKNIISYKMNQKAVPTRHSRFLPNFQITSDSGISKIVHKLNAQEQASTSGKKMQPVRRGEMKKVTKIESDLLSSNFMQIQIENEGQIKTIGQVVLDMSRQFLQVELQHLIKLVFDSIFRQTAKVTENNVIQYLLLCSWALQVVTAKYHKQRAQAANDVQKDRVEYSFSWVVDIMQTAHFELIYKILSREVNREKKKQFKVNFFHAGLKLFNSYLDVITEISNSMNMSERKNANVLMANMFRHDIAKILRIGFHQIIHEGVISTIIKVTHKFFKLLSVYSQGKILTIQTSKLLKKKKKKKSKQEYHYNEQEQELNLSNSDNESQKNVERDDEERYQERKYNEKSEFAIIAQYGIITKYLLFLKNDRFLQNSNQLNEAIFYYIYQIKKMLSGQWLFFQAQTMCVFQRMISNPQWTKKNKEKVKFIQQICRSFIKLIRKNPLALTQSLFRLSSLSLKDHILKNYSEEYVQSGEQEQNMFTDE